MAKKIDNLNKPKLKSFMNEATTHVKNGVLYFSSDTTVKEVADALKLNSSEIIKYFFIKKIMLNNNTVLTEEQIAEISLENDLDFKIIKKIDELNILSEVIEKSKSENLKDKRPPVITIMGHVDHGKTTLLDSIRKTNVTEGEAGGITQSIGAYQIEHNKRKLTFIDTPGHEAFTEMRARGSKITDIIIIVVSADDSVMPQTIESIDHAKAAGIPIIVAINKIDSPRADAEKVKTDVSGYELMPEEWGGSVPFVEISAKEGTGIPKLLDTINLVSDVEDYKTNYDDTAAGVVVETHMEKGRGNVITVLIQHGTLKKGDTLILDTEMSNVRVIYDDQNKEISSAKTSRPVKITGFPVTPDLGSKFVVIHDLKEGKKIVKLRKDNKKQSKFNNQMSMKMEQFLKKQEGEEKKVLSVILVADSTGSIEALEAQVKNLSSDKVKVNIIRESMGQVSKADILLSSANDAPIYIFNVKINNTTKDLIEKHKVRIFNYNVIYHLLEDMKKHMLGIQDTEYKEIEVGKSQVKTIFTFSKVGTIAGSGLTAGKVHNKCKVRIIRDGEVVHNGKISSLRIEKDAVKEVTGVGKEFAFTIENYNDIQEGDFSEFYELEEIIYE